jgi:hypothetical protein
VGGVEGRAGGDEGEGEEDEVAEGFNVREKNDRLSMLLNFLASSMM